MEMISAITKKRDWDTKILDPKISGKWKREFEIQGAKMEIVNKVFELLVLSMDEDKFQGDNEYQWILDITVDPNEIGLKCNGCECKRCGEDPVYNMEDGDITENKQRKNIDCTCDCVLNLDTIKQSYLEKFIVTNNKFVNAKLRKEFIKTVNVFTKGRVKDFHPGSGETMVDILHPSLYCYVDGITETKNLDGLEKSSLFQWIPCNYSLINKKFVSQIHGLDQKEFPELHNSIETIFSNILHGFQNVFSNLHKNKRTEDLISLNNFENLQVIVKIGSTELTPEKPRSSSSSFHLEGILEENIIATGIYYYDMQNITESYLSFRTVVDEYCVDYPQNHNDYVEAHYGLTEMSEIGDTETVMPLGKIHTKKNMSLVFPNFLQHRVDDFELVDKTKTGYRKILVFFLIDPRKRIISTENIVRNPMSLEEAKMCRELLMFHRKYKIKEQGNFFERGWSLCEH